MKLTTEDGTAVLEPSSNELQAALDRLGLRGNGFAVLEASEDHYLQVTGSRADGYLAEYREGSERTHHSSTTRDLTHQQMLDLLEAYRAAEPWKSSINWRQGFGQGPARRQPSRTHRVLVMLFAFIGAVSLASSVYVGVSTHRFLQRAVSVPGKVVRLVASRRTYAPIVDYVDTTGHTRTLVSTTGSQPPAFFESEAVTVLYDPEDPAFPLGAKIDSFGQLWGGTVFLLIFGAAFDGIAFLHWFVVLRKRRDAS